MIWGQTAVTAIEEELAVLESILLDTIWNVFIRAFVFLIAYKSIIAVMIL